MFIVIKFDSYYVDRCHVESDHVVRIETAGCRFGARAMETILTRHQQSTAGEVVANRRSPGIAG
jgi:hypothetical protein